MLHGGLCFSMLRTRTGVLTMVRYPSKAAPNLVVAALDSAALYGERI